MLVPKGGFAESRRKGIVTNLAHAGYSAAGEALNCDIWSIAVRAAVDLGADKLFCLTVPESQPFTLPAWVPVSDAEALLNRLVVQHQSWDDFQAPIVPHRRAICRVKFH